MCITALLAFFYQAERYVDVVVFHSDFMLFVHYCFTCLFDQAERYGDVVSYRVLWGYRVMISGVEDLKV